MDALFHNCFQIDVIRGDSGLSNMCLLLLLPRPIYGLSVHGSWGGILAGVTTIHSIMMLKVSDR